MTTQIDDHLDGSEQLSFVDGDLEPHELEAVERHLATCVECRDAVDDLAEASDGLTAFLHQSDFRARPMVYRGAKRRGLWINPWAAAAVVATLLAGVAVPRMLWQTNPPGWVTGAPAVFGNTQRFHSEVRHFIVEFDSWQASGTLQLVFEDTDLFSYRTNRTAETSTMVDSDIGLMKIRTSADSDADHELVVPSTLADRLVVRVAGETIRFTQDMYYQPIDQGSDGVVAFGQTVTIQLAAPGRAAGR